MRMAHAFHHASSINGSDVTHSVIGVVARVVTGVVTSAVTYGSNHADQSKHAIAPSLEAIIFLSLLMDRMMYWLIHIRVIFVVFYPISTPIVF